METNNLNTKKEFAVFCGNYRKFIVIAANKEEALKIFDKKTKEDWRYGMGFTIKDVTNVMEYTKEDNTA